MKKENKINRDRSMGKREVYEAPLIETVEVRVEQGFQSSPSSVPVPSSGMDESDYTW